MLALDEFNRQNKNYQEEVMSLIDPESLIKR